MIKRISIVTDVGGETFSIGDKNIVAFKKEEIQISTDSQKTFYLGLDIKGREIAKISASCPIVIESEY